MAQYEEKVERAENIGHFFVIKLLAIEEKIVSIQKNFRSVAQPALGLRSAS